MPNDTQAQAAPEQVAIAHSIFSAPALAAWAAQRWNIGAIEHAQLLQHGQNDWYEVRNGNQQFALRVLKSGARSSGQLTAELDWAAGLSQSGLAVSQALPARDGNRIAALDSPEGPRLVCLYSWISGATLTKDHTSSDARDAGRLLAAVHLAGCQLPASCRQHSLVDKLRLTASQLDLALANADERALIATARTACAAALSDESSLPQASLHGDAHFGNYRRQLNGQLALLDFDDCGHGALVADLTAYGWRNRCEQLPQNLAAAFLAGYQSIRKLTTMELAMLPALSLARAIYLAGVLARDRDVLGKVPGFDRPWGHYLGIIATQLKVTQL